MGRPRGMLTGDKAMITLAPSLPSLSLPSLSPLAPSPRCALAFQQPPPLPGLQRVLQSRPLRLLAACAAHILPPPRLELRIDVNQPRNPSKPNSRPCTAASTPPATRCTSARGYRRPSPTSSSITARPTASITSTSKTLPARGSPATPSSTA